MLYSFVNSTFNSVIDMSQSTYRFVQSGGVSESFRRGIEKYGIGVLVGVCVVIVISNSIAKFFLYKGPC